VFNFRTCILKKKNDRKSFVLINTLKHDQKIHFYFLSKISNVLNKDGRKYSRRKMCYFCVISGLISGYFGLFRKFFEGNSKVLKRYFECGILGILPCRNLWHNTICVPLEGIILFCTVVTVTRYYQIQTMLNSIFQT
jgi:hypothetical protein